MGFPECCDSRGFQGLLKEFKYKVAVGKVNIG